MRCNAVILSDGHIYQLIVTIGANKIETLLEPGIKTTVEMILFLGIAVCMITGILAQVIENLCVLKHSAVFLCEHQEFI